jgi:DNA-binding transcriptional regulator YiaG
MREFRHGKDTPKFPYHYTMCGLDDIYLVSGYEPVETDYGSGVIIQHQDELHRAIAMHLATSKKALAGKELRFLRKQMDLTQTDLADLLRVTDQTVARWEKGEADVSGPADLLVRVLFLAQISERVNAFKLAGELRSMMDERPGNRQLFKPTRAGWKPIAVGAN